MFLYCSLSSRGISSLERETSRRSHHLPDEAGWVVEIKDCSTCSNPGCEWIYGSWAVSGIVNGPLRLRYPSQAIQSYFHTDMT